MIKTHKFIVSPMIKEGQFDLDDDQKKWGFSEYAIITVVPVESTPNPVELATILDDLIKRRVIEELRWSRVSPLPHYRITRTKRRSLLSDETAESVSEEEMVKAIDWWESALKGVGK